MVSVPENRRADGARAFARPRLWSAVTVLLLVLLALPASPAHAAAGDLDFTFDTDGKVTTPINAGEDRAFDVALQSDGKIVAAGMTNLGGADDSFAVVRYKTDGSLDTTFSGDGKVETAFGTGEDEARAVAIQSDGKIVVAGFSDQDPTAGVNRDFALARYTLDGLLDPAFGSGGRVTTAIGAGDDFAFGVAVQPADGKIVVAGRSLVGATTDFAVARYAADGTLDPAFGTGGIATTAIGTGTDVAEAIALQSDGSIVAAGLSHNGTNFDFALVRYTANGALDTSFGAGGKVTTGIGTNDSAHGVAIQPDGKIVLAGGSELGGTGAGFRDFALVRYTSTGGLDTLFDTDGIVTTAVGSGTVDEAFDLALQTDGKIVAGGESGDHFAVVRYTSTGGIDTSFEIDGKVITSIGGDDSIRGVALGGKTVAVGHSDQGPPFGFDFAAARYLADPTISINDVTVAEGDAGTTPASFTVSLSSPAGGAGVTVGFATANGTATAPSDYGSNSGTLALAAGESSKFVTVLVNGDTVDEPDETFSVNLSAPTNATIADAQGVGTITDDDPPAIFISDVSVREGHSGTTAATFSVFLTSPAPGGGVTVDVATADGTATAPADYEGTGGTLAFAAGESSKSVTVLVKGDTLAEADETFSVNLSAAVGATIADPQGVGTIEDDDGGYWLVGRDGGVFAFGAAEFFGSLGGRRLAAPVVGMDSTPNPHGYWLVASDGGVFTFGAAGFFGSTGGRRLNAPVVGMAATPSGNGYWLVASDGGVFAFGAAPFLGSMGGTRLNARVVGIAATPSGGGYWLFAADGGVFAFGDAGFFGSMGAVRLAQPVVGGDSLRGVAGGYWLVASDGGVFAFGAAPFLGSAAAGLTLLSPVVGMSGDSANTGYWLAQASGEVRAFGSAVFQGSVGGTRLAAPIVGIEAVGS